MSYSWDNESKADISTDFLGFGEIGSLYITTSVFLIMYGSVRRTRSFPRSPSLIKKALRI